MSTIRPLCVGICVALMWMVPAPLFAQTANNSEAPRTTPTVVLDLPRLEALRDRTRLLLQQGQTDEADALVTQALKATPELPELWVLRTLVRMAQGNTDAALNTLERAVSNGFAGLDEVLDLPVLAPLREAAEERGLVAKSNALLPPKDTSAPASPTGQELPVTLENLLWDNEIRRFRVLVDLPPRVPPLALPAPGKRARADQRAAYANLNRLINRGMAAGFSGIVYDNRDAGHSELDMADFPGMVVTRYSGPLRQRKVNYGLADDLLFEAPVIGNSSTAYKGTKAPRSLPRSAMINMPGPFFAFQNYLRNQFYVYPEHRDHDAVDTYPANWPYMMISQGSSYQDRPFVRAAAWALAAMRPDTRDFVLRENLMAPTLQMILRRSQAHVRTRASYFTGLAHPTVFQQDSLRLDRIVALAQSLAPDTVPPVPVLQVLSDEFASHAGLLNRSERLFDTGSAVARIWRGPEWEKTMVVAADSIGPPRAPDAKFHWVLLRGDPDLVRIEPLDPKGTRARISVNWHDRRPISPRDKRLSDRVDIGVFIAQKTVESAPAFVSISFPTHQRRRYAAGPDGKIRLEEVDFDALAAKRDYDPVLHWSAPWRDVYAYDNHAMTGWTRIFADATPEQHFMADGRTVNGRMPAYTLGGIKNGSPFVRVANFDSSPDQE